MSRYLRTLPADREIEGITFRQCRHCEDWLPKVHNFRPKARGCKTCRAIQNQPARISYYERHR